MTGARKSAKYLFIGGVFSKAISFVGSVLLARILFPEDYGYLLIALIVTGFIQVIGNMGFENFYLQEKIESKELETKILSITFKLRLAVNGLLFLIQIAASYIVELYYKNPIVGSLLRVFSLNILIMAFSQINLFILRKQLNYKPEVYANTARDIVATVFKVIFALTGFGALSFAIGAVIGAVVRLIILVQYQYFKPIWKLWDVDVFKKIFYFGKHSLLSGMASFFSTQIDKIILANIFPAQNIGYYNFSNVQANLLFSYAILPQGSLIISYTSKHKSNPKYLFDVLSKIGFLINYIMVPVTIFLFLNAHNLINVVFGEKWIESVPIFKAFLIYYFVRSFSFPFNGILTAIGLPQVLSKISVYQLTLITVALTLTGIYVDNIVIYAWTSVFISSVFMLLKASVGLYKIDLSMVTHINNQKIHLMMSLLFYLLCVYIIDGIDNIYTSLFVQLFALLLTAVLQILVFKKSFVEIFKIILGHEHKIVNFLS